jgi:ABC-type multidrug transport system permease subunit
MKTQGYIFWMFLRRDLYVYKKRFWSFFIDYSIIETSINVVIFGYFLPNLGGQVQSPTYVSTVVLGSVLWSIVPLTFSILLDFWFDFEHANYIAYQVTILSPWLVLLEKVLFLSLYCFSMLLFYIPLCKLILGDLLATGSISWIKLCGMIYLSVLVALTLNLCMACYFESSDKIANMWLRIFHPLMSFGGVTVPLVIMQQYSQVLGTVVWFNPFLYITEGVKDSVLGGTTFIPALWCMPALLVFAGLFFYASTHYLKRKMDHV